jgi:hypothetical protein
MLSKLIITLELLTLLLVGGAASVGFCADVAGTVSDRQGHAIPGVQVIIRYPDAGVPGKALTDARGNYQISGLLPGEYECALDARGTAFKSGSVIVRLGSEGLKVNWQVSAADPAVGLVTGAAAAGGLLGLTPAGVAGLIAAVAGVTGGGVVGGFSAAGGFAASAPPAQPAHRIAHSSDAATLPAQKEDPGEASGR